MNKAYRDCSTIITILNEDNHLKEREFIKELIDHKKVFPGVRHKKIIIYKCGAKIFEVTQKNKNLIYYVNTTYAKKYREGKLIIDFDELKENIQQIIDAAIKEYKEQGDYEKICQQWIVDANNKDIGGYQYIDMEYVTQGTRLGRFDMVAISKNKENGKHNVVLIELKVGTTSIYGSWENNEKVKEDATYIFQGDMKHPIKFGSGIVGHIADYYRFLADKELYNNLKVNICSIIKCQTGIGYVNGMNNICTDDLCDKPIILIACYTGIPKDAYEYADDTNRFVSVDDLKREVKKCLFHKFQSKYNLEDTFHSSLTDGFMKYVTEEFSDNVPIGQKINDEEFDFIIKFIDPQNSQDTWKCY